MKISIVTVSYNSAQTLADTLVSVAGQTHPDVEHIVVDGASTDGTLKILDQHRRTLSRVVSEPDRGIYDAMNKGFAMATGEVIGTLNSDDMLAHPEVLAQVARTFEDPSVDACYGDLVYVSREDPNRIVRYWQSRPYTDGLFARGWMPPHPTFYIRRRAYERCGGFDLGYRLQSDFEFTLRMLAVHRLSSVYLPETLIKMRMGGVTNNRLTNVVKGNIEAYRACRSNGVNVTPFFILQKIFSRVSQFWRRPQAGRRPKRPKDPSAG
jgi:glycosyltransferase involved in cell wall biosynthesis